MTVQLISNDAFWSVEHRVVAKNAEGLHSLLLQYAFPPGLDED
jgi:hypothetical protein